MSSILTKKETIFTARASRSYMKKLIILGIATCLLAACSWHKNRPESTVVLSPKDSLNPVQDTILIVPNIEVKFLLGKFDYRKDSTFVLVDSALTTKPLFVKKGTYEAFKKMHQAAKKDSIDLRILSGTRNFYEQKWIWERKWKRYKDLPPFERTLKILEYSAMPSSSRHHWGTDIDINNLNNNYFDKGRGKKEYQWLQAHANNFGFYQVYTDKSSGRTGYQLERWHWSYLPLSSTYLKAYNQQIRAKDIEGFLGAAYADSVKIVKDYVNGIDRKLKQAP